MVVLYFVASVFSSMFYVSPCYISHPKLMKNGFGKIWLLFLIFICPVRWHTAGNYINKVDTKNYIKGTKTLA